MGVSKPLINDFHTFKVRVNRIAIANLVSARPCAGRATVIAAYAVTAHGRAISVAVMLWLKWAFLFHTDVICLLLRQWGQVRTDPVQVQTSHFFIEVLGQNVDVIFVSVTVAEQFNLSEDLVGERI